MTQGSNNTNGERGQVSQIAQDFTIPKPLNYYNNHGGNKKMWEDNILKFIHPREHQSNKQSHVTSLVK